MKHVIVNLTPAEAEALMRVVDHAAEVDARWLIIQKGDTVKVRAAYRAANKLQDAIRNRVTAERRSAK